MRKIATDNPDVLFRECRKMVAAGRESMFRLMKNRDRIRRSMYRVAVNYGHLISYHYEWLKQQAENHGGLETMLQDWFAPLKMLDEDYHALLDDIRHDVTEDQYLRATAGSWSRRLRLERRGVRVPHCNEPASTVPDRITESAGGVMVTEEDEELGCEGCEALSRENRALKQEASRQELRIAELEASLNKATGSANES